MTIILRPSSAGRWAFCSGSPVMEAHYPEDQASPAAREGTAGHHYGVELMNGTALPVGALAPNGHPITAEMVEGGEIWAQDVWAEMARSSPQMIVRFENPVTMHGLIHPQNEGTPDAWLVDAVRKLIVVWDYKFGHKAVEVFRNLQLIDYLAGVIEGFEFTLADVADWTISLRVVQPRNFRGTGPVQRWETTGAAIWPTIEWLSDRATEAAHPNAPTRTGAWCDDCEARAHCPALLLVGGAAIDKSGENVPQELPLPALGLMLRQVKDAIQRLEALESGLEEVVEAKIRAGADVPYFSFKDEPGRLNWEVPIPEVLALGKMFAVDLRKKDDAITPTQAIAAGIDESVIGAYAKRKTARKLTLVDSTAAAKVFQ